MTPPISVLPGLPPAHVDKDDAANRAEDRDAAEDKGINDRCRRRRQSQGADQNRTDQTDRVGLENVRRHACAIADIVAHVIRDRGRIARIVFFQAAFDFADQVRADVRGFGVNAATESREDTDQARAQRQADEAAHGRFVADHFTGDGVEDSDREERQTDNQQSRDSTAIESDPHRSRSRFGRRLRRAGIGQNRDSHSDKPSRERADRADQKTERGRVVLPNEEQNENDDGDRANRNDLPVEIGFRALLNGARDFLHPGVPGRGLDHRKNKEKGKNKARACAEHGKRDAGSEERESEKSHKWVLEREGRILKGFARVATAMWDGPL